MVSFDAQKFITSKLNKNEDLCFKFCVENIRQFTDKQNLCLKNCFSKFGEGMLYLKDQEKYWKFK